MTEDYQITYIGLGSNLDSPQQQINQALDALAQLPMSQSLMCSPWYRSKAIGPGDQPDYINAVACIHTKLSPEHLLEHLQGIENQHGRQRSIRWGARTLDLDLLLYSSHIIDTETLSVPHPEMLTRNFVIYPLCDLAPNLLFSNGRSVSDIKKSLNNEGLVRIDDININNPIACKGAQL